MQCEFLSLEDLLDIASTLRIGPVRDLGLLNAAALRPQTTLMGQYAYPSTTAKAAALLESLTKNHALVDGNKRLAWAACAVFLSLNHMTIKGRVSNDDVVDLVISAASSDIGLAQIEETLADWTESPGSAPTSAPPTATGTDADARPHSPQDRAQADSPGVRTQGP